MPTMALGLQLTNIALTEGRHKDLSQSASPRWTSGLNEKKPAALVLRDDEVFLQGGNLLIG
jgi:hypothetical protein